MTLRINTNISALNAHKSMIANDAQLGSSLERMSTGLRINKAADDSSGMAIADSLKAQSLGIGQAIRNANDGISMVQTADGALQESINIINTIKTKAIQAASDSQTTATRKAIQNDIDKLLEELNIIATTTSFNGQKLLSGVFTDKAIQIGAFANETANISIGSTEASKIGHISQADLSLASESGGEVQLTITSSITGEKLTLSTIDVQYNNDRANGMGALADEMNRYTSVTGISAKAVVEMTSTKAIQGGSTGEHFKINGIPIGDIPVENGDENGALIDGINDKTSQTGVEAYKTPDGRLTLSSVDGRAIQVEGALTDLIGSNAYQMSTIGYLQLTQSGVGEFQIEGIGAGAVGGDIVLGVDMETVEDSVIAAGSTLEEGSRLAPGSVVGGDAIVESTVASTQLDYEIGKGSTLYPTTEIAKGTVIGGTIVVAGDTFPSSATGVTVLEQDMLLAEGSTLKVHSILGAGTIVTTNFTSSATGANINYTVGQTLASPVELTREVTLARDMTLAYSTNSSNSSVIKAGSTLTDGSTLGAKFEIGVTFRATDGSGTITDGATTIAPIKLFDDLSDSVTAGGMTIPVGSMLAHGTELILSSTGAGTTWNGPTLHTNRGTIEFGDTISENTVYTLVGDQVLSENFTAGGSTSLANTIKTGSILNTGFTNGENALAATDGATVTMSIATMASGLTLESGSELAAGSKLLAGSKLGNATYVMGGILDATATGLSVYKRMDLASGSLIQKDSVLSEGSTVGGAITLRDAATLDSDMSVTAGTILKQDTLLKAGTTITQDMVLNTQALAAGSTVELKAGAVLTSDLYVQADTTLSKDMMLKEQSVIEVGSVLAVNTSNSGSVGLGDTQTYNLSDINVLTAEGAQRAISIADSALTSVDATRASLGSVQNQLSSTISNLSVTQTNIQASESTIRDVDFAEESMIFSKMQLLSQTSSYALSQANASAQNIMSLLQ